MLKHECGIYMLTNKITEERYIGQAVDIIKRYWTHKYCAKKNSNMLISQAIRKYGIENFEVSILKVCQRSELDTYERYFIEALKPEYNLNGGGRGTYKCNRRLTDLEKERSREAAKKQWADLSEAQKAHVIKYQLTGPGKGHPVSDATREKLRQANLGKKQSSETIAKRSKKLKGVHKENRHHWKKVRCIETREVFEMVKLAALKFNIRASAISAVLKDKQKTAGGYRWEYVL